MRPLDGILIVEAVSLACPLGLRLAASMAGRIAADLGAKVVKLEGQDGDPVRRIPPFVAGVSALFAFLNAGKKSVAVAAKDGRVLSRLLVAADAAFVDDSLFRDNGPAFNLRATAVLSMHSMRGNNNAPASEFTAMALGGLLDLIGDPQREPLRLGGHQLAYAAGLAAYTGVAAALCRKDSSSEVVEVSLLDTAVWLNWKAVASGALGRPVPTRSGRVADWPVVRCLDGWVAVVYQDGDWPALRDLIGDPKLSNPRFESRDGRRQHAAELLASIETAFRHLPRQAIQAMAIERRLPLGVVLSPRELDLDRQVIARGFLQPARTPGETVWAMPRLPVLWSGEAFTPGDVPALDRSLELAAP